MSDPQDHEDFSAVIQIDRSQYRVGQRELRGGDLKQIPNPGVGPDRDLFVLGAGSSEDQLVRDDDVLSVADGMSFFTVPRTIVAGRPLGR